jgi:hypothetical protein
MIDVKPATITIDGIEYVAELATVESTHLGYEDHGIGTATLRFAGPAWGQSNEARCLSTFDKEAQRQRGTALGFDFVLRVIDVFGCETWERVKGQRVYVLRTEPYGRIEGIANTFDPARHLIFDPHAAAFAAEATR